MTFATLRALHAVIGTAIDEMERTYRARAPNLDYPSLDEPYYPTAQHTPEEELAETLKADPDVAAASKRIVAACGQLSTTVNKPWFGLMEDVQAVRPSRPLTRWWFAVLMKRRSRDRANFLRASASSRPRILSRSCGKPALMGCTSPKF